VAARHVVGKSSSDGSDDVSVASPVSRSRPVGKLQSWSSLFRAKPHRTLSSSARPRDHRLPVHVDVSRPFKPVGHCPPPSAADRRSQNRPPVTVSSECPLPPVSISPNQFLPSLPQRPSLSSSSECPLLSQRGGPADRRRPRSASPEDPLAPVQSSSDDDEDAALPSSHAARSPVFRCVDGRTAVRHRAPAPASESEKLSAAARITTALSQSGAAPPSPSAAGVDGDYQFERRPPGQQCRLAPTTRISMALTQRSSRIGRRLSTMLHNSRLHQRSSSAAGICAVILLTAVLSSLIVVVIIILHYTNRQQNRHVLLVTHTRAHPFNGPFSGTTRMSRYQKGKTILDFTEARDSEW